VKAKRRLAASAPGNRLLIVGGSGALFGISAAQIERETGVRSINLAAHAGLGREYLLNEARHLARSGDTLLLALEYDLYASSGLDAVLLDYLFARDPTYLRSLPVTDQARAYLALEPDRIVEGWRNRIRPPSKRTSGYQATTLNDHGDETANREAARTKVQLQRAVEAPPIDVLMRGIPANDPGLASLANFAEWCRKSNVRLLATFPNTVYRPQYAEPTPQRTLQQLEERFSALGVPVLGTPREFMYEASSFYDSRYHLTDVAMERRTARLVELLRPKLEPRAVTASGRGTTVTPADLRRPVTR
jgi:hypothetical protein